MILIIIDYVDNRTAVEASNGPIPSKKKEKTKNKSLNLREFHEHQLVFLKSLNLITNRKNGEKKRKPSNQREIKQILKSDASQSIKTDQNNFVFL